MKKLANIMMALAAMFAVSSAVSAQTDGKKDSKTATVVIAAEIDCNHCKQKIEKNIAFEKGVKDLSVSLPDKTVTITYRTDKTSAEALCAAINKLGYKSVIKK